MNSFYRDYRGNAQHEDRLQKSDWMRRFLRRWHFEQEAPSDVVLAQLSRLRDALWRIAESALQRRTPNSSDVRTLNQALSAAPLRRELVKADRQFRIKMTPARRDWTWIQSEIAADFATLLSDEKMWDRVKLCANPDCQWIFYDASKSRTRNWCGPLCSNLIKVRRFRARTRRASAR